MIPGVDQFAGALNASAAQTRGIGRQRLACLPGQPVGDRAEVPDLHVELLAPALGDSDFELQLGRVPQSEVRRLRSFVNRRAASESLQGLCLLQDFACAWAAASGVAAATIARDERGKPYLAVPERNAPAVNLSHGGYYLALAVAPHGRIGVDVEPCRPLRPALLAACCHPRERAWIEREEAPHARCMRFARLWTLKESLMKATGAGLAIDPLDIEFDLDGAPELLRSPCGEDWQFWTLSLDADTQLAICHGAVDE